MKHSCIEFEKKKTALSPISELLNNSERTKRKRLARLLAKNNYKDFLRQTEANLTQRDVGKLLIDEKRLVLGSRAHNKRSRGQQEKENSPVINECFKQKLKNRPRRKPLGARDVNTNKLRSY